MADPIAPYRLIPSQATFDTPLVSAYDYDGSGNCIYIGKAQPGTAKSAAFWQIQKLTYNGSNQLTDVQWATGKGSFASIWNNRAALSYS